MASTPTRNEEEKGSRMSQAATSLGGGPVSMGVSLSRSEEFLTQISTELTDEALFTAGYGTNPVPTKEKQTQDRGTQISKHVFFKTRGTDTRSDRNHTRTKTHLLPSPRDKNVHQSSSFTSH
ncbi:putative protein T-ENOL isoform X2 [Panthera uncia]|uniref:putative protein T-ENOL isoform X2 n=1 Tax=Panthera uncia TaxID=29064 RepID=UPI0020FFB6BD|nr:putative protein T-ENOL isoform X2 [Panthera uncia]